MVAQKVELKPSLQRIADAREAVKARIADIRLYENPDKVLVEELKNEKQQLKELFTHMSLDKPVRVTAQYVFNMSDGTLEVLREFLQAECESMLHSGKNHTSRIYVNRQNELTAVLTEQKKRAEQVEESTTAQVVNAA